MKSRAITLCLMGAILGSSIAFGSGAGQDAWPKRQEADLLSHLKRGHWLEARGAFVEAADGTVEFEGDRIEVKEPRRYESIWGTASAWKKTGDLEILGRRVRVGDATKLRGARRIEQLLGQRVRVLGWRSSGGSFIAHRLELREPGVDRIVCRVDDLALTPTEASKAATVRLCGFEVVLRHHVRQRLEKPIAELDRVAPRRFGGAERPIDLEDQLGPGYELSPELHLSLRQDLTYSGEENFAFDPSPDDDPDDDPDDRRNTSHQLRARLDYAPSSRVEAVVDLRHRYRSRDSSARDGQIEGDLRLNEAYVTLHQVAGFDWMIGRQDFDDPREWIFDQNLDALRARRTSRRYQVELAIARTLDHGSRRDRSADNFLLYLSNNNSSHHLAGYVVHRDFGRDGGTDTATHTGVRALSRWGRSLRSWLELSYLEGQRAEKPLSAWGGDLGVVFDPKRFDGFRFAAGYAYGSGGDSEGSDSRFRQTGLQDNNARLTGRSSVRYYGELIDPELSNLHITTLAVGYQPTRSHSFELIGHTYRQDVASRRLTRTNLDQRPDGRSRDLGWELDLVYNFTPRRSDWGVEVVAATFHQGSAFGEGEPATLLSAQIRYRYGRER